jgi:hypothetical protein
MAQTVGDLIRSAMRKVGILGAGEPLPPEDSDDSRVIFAQMVDGWTLESLLIPVVSVVTKTLVTGESEYTIGIYPDPQPVPLPATHIETARPEKILAAFIRDGYETDYPQEVIDVTTFSRISRKTNSSRPSRFYLRKGWPLNTILFESLPYADETLHLEVIQPLSQYLSTASLTDVVNLPPGYERILIYNLGIDLADEWGKQVSPAVATIAVQGKKRIKRSNYRKLVLSLDRALVNRQRAKGTYIIEQGP